jgi:salicylate hydroxylase
MRIAVAGAGIAGLTAAISLAQRGFSVDIHEQAPVLKEIGAGIQLSPNATKILTRLGLEEHLRPHIFEPQAIEIRDAQSARILATIPLGDTARRRYGAPYITIHRADLQAALIFGAQRENGIIITLNSAVEPARTADGGSFFSAGGHAFQNGIIIIAADGVHSRLRTGYFGLAKPRRLGKTAWRAILPIADVPPSTRLDRVTLWLGHGAHLVHYPVQAGGCLNIVLIAANADSATPPSSAFGAKAKRLIDAVTRWVATPLHETDPAGPWVRDHAVLIGDAAHAMPPSAAQGGAQAMEDAYVLARCLDRRRDEPAAALRHYEAERRARITRVAREARRNLAIYNLRTPAADARNIVLAALPTKVLLSRLDWLFAWEADQKIP